MSDPTPDKSPDPFAAPHATFSLPRAVFDSVPGRRTTYIIAYAIFIVLVYGPRMLAFAGLFPVDSLAYALVGAGLAAYSVFVYQFIRAMRIMGFEYWISLGVGLIAISAFPGPILVAYIDRKIATAWDAADPAGGYRQKPR